MPAQAGLIWLLSLKRLLICPQGLVLMGVLLSCVLKSRALRVPWRSSDKRPARNADRTIRELLPKLPPRTTRSEPEVGPVGSI